MLAAAVLAVALAGCVTPATLLRGPNLLYFLRMVAPRAGHRSSVLPVRLPLAGRLDLAVAA